MVQVHPPRSHAIHARVRSFSRAGGRLTPAQSQALDQFGPAYIVDIPRQDAIRTVARSFRLDPAALFPVRLAQDDAAASPAANNSGVFASPSSEPRPLIIEVGSGGGEAILAHAQAHPDTDYLAVEVWETAIARIVRDAARTGLTNVRVVPADASPLFATALPEACANEVWTFFPDPWRKPRHRKRRLVSPAFAACVARILVPGGTWRLATDWSDYAYQMRDVLEAAESGQRPYFTLPDRGARPDQGAESWTEGSLGNGPDPGSPAGRFGGWSQRWEGRVVTRFERRGIEEGRVIRDLTAVRSEVAWMPASKTSRS